MNDTDQERDSDDPREEELVAYLDGELSDEQSRQVEEQLTGDEAYRQSLQRLERAWNCLDALPTTAVGDAFTSSTVEMIAVAASEEIAQQRAALPRQQRLRSVLTAGALLASLLVGFFVFAVVWPDPNERLIRDYGLLKHLDEYLQIQDIEFLRSLDQEIKAADKEVILSEMEVVPLTAPQSTAPQSTAERLTAIEQMKPEEKAQLASAQERFEALSTERQETAWRVYREIHQAEDSPALLTTLSIYYDWIMRLSPGQRAEFSNLSSEKRLDNVKKIYAQQQQQRAQQLSPEDMKSLLGWLQSYVFENQREILAKVPEQYRREMSMRLHHDGKNKARMGLMMMVMRKREIIGNLQVSHEDMLPLKQRLSLPARKVIEQAGSLEQQQKIIRGWIYRTIRTRTAQAFGGPRTPVSQADLEKFFAEKLTNDQREYLLSLSGEEMQRELRRVYQDSINLAPRSRPKSGPAEAAYDGPQSRPGGKIRRGGPGDRPPGNSRREPPFNNRPGGRLFPPSRGRTKDPSPSS